NNALDSVVSAVQCDGSELSLLECPLSYLSPAISSPTDAAVVCQAQSTVSSNCSYGDIRLVNGSNKLEGRLEICINKVWGTICSQGFTADDADIVCSQIGLPFNGKNHKECSAGVQVFSRYNK
ncbi:MAG: scavenger receptor cysteine-rich domain-containing protein, partial [Proteobacteria bacterium]|nr:scavenger receptor cysteine-rich domain-containing protein [Pseudomonadota bacterium]